MKIISLLLIILCSSMGLAQTQTGAIVPTHQLIKEQSRITYASNVNGEVMEGEFKDYNAIIHFDPSNLQTSYFRFNLRFSPQSVTTDNKAIQQGIMSLPIANMGLFVPATFIMREVEYLSDNDYRGRGVLEIMGRKQVIEMQLTVIKADDPLLGQGNGIVSFTTFFKVDRAKFGKFKGEANSGYNVSDLISVTAHLVTKTISK